MQVSITYCQLSHHKITISGFFLLLKIDKRIADALILILTKFTNGFEVPIVYGFAALISFDLINGPWIHMTCTYYFVVNFKSDDISSFEIKIIPSLC